MQAAEPPQSDFDPRLIYTAHASSYWTGRFTALHDRLRGELLKPHNLAAVIESFNEEAEIMLAHASAANNPSTSAYAPSTALRPRGIILSHGGASHPRPRIPLSSTSGAVLQAPHPAPAQRPYQPRPGVENNAPAMDAAMLVDDDTRRRRALLNLEALCMTAEARRSMRAWQAAYARRERRVALLPGGCQMDGREADGAGEIGGGGGSRVEAAGTGLLGRLFGSRMGLAAEMGRRRTLDGGG